MQDPNHHLPTNTTTQIPCPSWCLTNHDDGSEFHERRTLGQSYAEVDALVMQRPGFETVKWIFAELEDPEHLLTPNEAREIAYGLLQAAAILDSTPEVER